MSLEDGLRLEAKLVGKLIASPTSKNLIDLFQSSEVARRGGEANETARAYSEAGSRVGILGAGVMGGGLAALLARKDYRVRIKDIAHEGIQAGLCKVRELYDARVRRRRMTRSERDNRLASITTTLDESGFSSTPFIIEAVVEDLEIKKRVLRSIEQSVPDGAILTSNTSALSITEMGRALERPDRFVGLHFFNPVDRMPLVEIIRGEQTSDDTLAAAEAVARSLGKVPVRVGDGPGFLVNRLLGPYLGEAVRLFEEGYSPVDIDKTIRDFGMPMGPFELIDEVGLDVAAKVSAILGEAFGDRARPAAVMTRLRDTKGLLGKKSGRGFYVYRGKSSKRFNDDVVKLRPGSDRDFRPTDSELWIKRLIYPVVDEAARALEEKIVGSPSELDLAMVMGTGFAPFRGGPLRFADSIGTRAVCEGLESTGDRRLEPSALLKKLSSEEKTFYSLESKREGEATNDKVGSAGS